jgi:hypothetical protein
VRPWYEIGTSYADAAATRAVNPVQAEAVGLEDEAVLTSRVNTF